MTKKRIYYDELLSKIFSRLENIVKEADPDIDLQIKTESITTFPAYIESVFLT